MTKLTTALKRQITDDWKGLFPSFAVYQPLWLIRRFGPVLHGICLDRDSGNASYLPTAHMHSLCRPFPVVALSLAQPLLSERSGTVERINVEFHSQKFADAAQRLRRQSLLSLDQPLSLAGVLNACGKYRTLGRPDSMYPVNSFEDVVLLLAWAGKTTEANTELDRALVEMAGWPPTVMQRHGSAKAWGERLRAQISERPRLLAVVEEQVAALNVSAIADNPLV